MFKVALLSTFFIALFWFIVRNLSWLADPLRYGKHIKAAEQQG
jgi:hypothetical protein